MGNKWVPEEGLTFFWTLIHVLGMNSDFPYKFAFVFVFRPGSYSYKAVLLKKKSRYFF